MVAEVFEEKGAVPAAQVGPRRLASETILACGSDDQKRRYLRPILTGEHAWCQLFSEPGSGSDLAGASTRAQLVDGRWILNGQKVWNTSAHHADFGILLARSDWDLPKHQGLSYFLLDMRQPGVEVRPLKQMNGHQSFNEVFITNAVVPRRGSGRWRRATAGRSPRRRCRSSAAPSRGGRRRAPVNSSGRGRIYDEYEAELRDRERALHLVPAARGPSRPGAAARARDRRDRATRSIRQEIAKLLCLQTGAMLAAAGAEAKRKGGSTEIVPAGSIGKLAASVIARQASHVHTMISGADAMLAGPQSAEGGIVAEVLISVPAISIAGGTDEIQRNIIAERVLGMPRGYRADEGSVPRHQAQLSAPGARDRRLEPAEDRSARAIRAMAARTPTARRPPGHEWSCPGCR